MRSFLAFSCFRWLYPLLAAIALLVLGQAAGHAQGSGAPRAGMSRPQMSRPQMPRTFAMPSFAPNPAVHLGMIPMFGGYGMARPIQAMPRMPSNAAMPYGGFGSYGGSQGYTSGYQNSGEEAPAGSEAYTTESQPSRQERSWSSLLTASGVPNDNGQLRWPLGLRILASPATDELREQIDALFQEAASQTEAGSVSSPLIQEMSEAVKKFRRLLLKDKAERFGMPLAVYDESERFLNHLEHAAQLFKAGLQGPGGQDRLTTTNPSISSPAPSAVQNQKKSMAEVGLYDNYFQPKTITVPVGTTIEWANHGQHRHTVTLDDRQWSSLELNKNGIYQYTFTQPGIYRYHCALHPQEMRGTIIVK